MYENYFPYFDEKIAGLPVVSKYNNTALSINYPTYGKGWSWDEGGLRVGYATGRYGTYEGRTIVQVFLEFSDYAYGWVYMDEFQFGTIGGTRNSNDVQKLVNEIIANNQKILLENLISARLIQVMESDGVRVPDEVKNVVRTLQTRLNERDAQLASNEYLTSRQTAAPDVEDKYINALNSLMGAKIGVVLTLSITTIIIVSALLGAAAATALYFALRGNASQSASDYKISKEVQDILKDLSPEHAAKVEAEIRNAWGAGYKVGGNSALKNIGLLLLGVGGFFVLKNASKFLKRNKN